MAKMTTDDVLLVCWIGPSEEWKPAPASNIGPLFIRNKGAAGHTLHDTPWLAKQIHGTDYEWALPKYPTK